VFFDPDSHFERLAVIGCKERGNAHQIGFELGQLGGNRLKGLSVGCSVMLV
jgi:hypothetical protein